MCKCIGGALLTIMSCLTLGLCLAAVVILLIIVETKDIPEATKEARIVLIVVLVITALIFIFAIYASCCGKICARRTLSAIFLIFAVVLLIIAIIMFTYTDRITAEIGKFWEEGEKHNQKVIDKIEESLKCCGYNSDKGCPADTERCKDKIQSEVNKIAYAIGVILVVICILLLICTIIGCSSKCAPREDEPLDP